MAAGMRYGYRRAVWNILGLQLGILLILVIVAAGLGAILVIPDRLKDQEFDRTVEEWSRTEAAMRSPTDGLLTVPGSEFLGRGPSIAGPAARRGS
jgi:hypothetical protein